MSDLRVAIRSLRATPLVAAAAILSLALGIGANTAVFSLLDSLALKSLPIRDPGRVVRLSSAAAPDEGGPYSLSFYDELRRHRDLFDGTAAYNCCGSAMLASGGTTDAVTRMWVSGDFFPTLGVSAALGRTIQPEDDRAGGGPDGVVAMITDRLWRQRFGARADIAGLHVIVERVPVTIVGVLPPHFLGVEVGRTIDIALPARTEPAVMPAIPFNDNLAFLTILARLRSDRTPASTLDALHAAQPEIREATRPPGRPLPDWLMSPLLLSPAGRGSSALRSRFERPLVVLLAIAALVLLIASANLANLLLARGEARRGELAVRVALGASRWQLARPVLVESLAMAAGGTAVGLLFAAGAERAITAALSTASARVVLDLSFDWRLFAFTTGTMTVVALLFGVMPARRAAHVDPIEQLNARGRGTAGAARGGLSNALLVAQVATSLALIAAAGLFVRTFSELVRAPLGFDRDRVVTATVTAPNVAAGERKAFYRRLADVAAAVPGVAATGGSANPPLIGGMFGDFVVSAPGTKPADDAEAVSQIDTVTPGWFAAEGIPLRAGRDFDDRDTPDRPHAMIVNDAFVRRLLGARADAVGTRLALSFRVPIAGDIPYDTRTIVGVVGDAVFRSVRERSTPAIYLPLEQFDGPVMWTSYFLSIRSRSASPRALTHDLAAAFAAANPEMRTTFRPVADQVDEALAEDRLVAALSTVVGALALVLAAIGLYGVTAYTVARQRSEIGIRLALGAQPSRVLAQVISRVAALVAVGIGAGALLGLSLSRFAASLLFGVSPRDPVAFAVAAVVLALVGLIAACVPAYRASRLDPADVLRQP
ncbi:MAG TPA: ADOP family duplicated permease [Vicinamibacterales bacterium]|nr:ADOP family duplicated permease [Vicinamibacterales bacterium]